MDFVRVKERSKRGGSIQVFPDFIVRRSRDLMVRGRSFYAIWDEEAGLWSTDEYDVQRMVDAILVDHAKSLQEKTEDRVSVLYMSDYSTNAWRNFRSYLGNISDNSRQLDESLTFANTKVTKTSYVSRRLPYSLEAGSTEAYDSLMKVLYAEEERQKLEWAIGAVVSGEAKDIQKFIVLYGEGGSGKSTFLNIVQKLFEGYYTTFEAKALTSNNNNFSTEVFKLNPLVAIQHDGDLSGIQDNTKLNSIVSHEMMTMNEKYKPSYMARANCMLFMATNKPVRITDAKSGIIRRLIDVKPTGELLPPTEYFSLMSRIDFELGAIAHHCLTVYRTLGKNFYSTYKPLGMILETDTFFNFVENNYLLFLDSNGVSLTQAYTLYKEYCEDSSIKRRLPKYKFRDELKNYFDEFYDVTRIDNRQVRSYYKGFKEDKFTASKPLIDDKPTWLFMDADESILDVILEDAPAQLANRKYETPAKAWDNVKTTLKTINTKTLHYVKPLDPRHIVIDFDIRGLDGEKNTTANLTEASKFPPTYAEFSKSGSGVHLHYYYTGDLQGLSRLYSPGIEIKVFNGNASLRRKVTKCNRLDIAEINDGLPTKVVKMINDDVVKNEKSLRALIHKNLRKEIHPATKPSVDFIHKLLEDAHASGVPYDVRDLRSKILTFAAKSTNQSLYCIKRVNEMQFNSDDGSVDTGVYADDRLVFFDVEVLPNLVLVCWKYQGVNNPCIHMINPSPQEIEDLLKMRLVGFNCRRYDNHILYALLMGYSTEMIYDVSSSIISGKRRALFREAYSLSFADVYDFASVKQSLKKFQLELGIHHVELGIPFDEPVPHEKWQLVIDYCDNDVIATEKVFEARKADFVARQILSELSGLTINDTTQSHTARIIFGKDRKPQDKFNYTDLSVDFPGYTYSFGKSTYRGETTGEGGYVYSEPGFYKNVALLDVASMHPTSIELLDLFGPYTSNYSELIEARIAIKHKDYDKAKELLGGVLAPYLLRTEDADALSYALKIAINIVYGLTSAKFENPFKDIRNKDNIVAKRGALFMVDLKHAVQELGYTVAHIKTDSIKIPDATPEIIKFVFEFGAKYGYTFEHEATYEKFLLVNDAVYVAKKKTGDWTTTGLEFSRPYVFKTLFSKEPIVFEDLCEVKAVTTALYLNMDEHGSSTLDPDLFEENLHFVGKVGSFVPVKPGSGGGELLRKKDDNYHAATGSKGWRWLEASTVKALDESIIDTEYFRKQVDDAIKHIEEFVPLNELLD